MKSIATSTIIILCPLAVGAAPYGLLRINDGPLARTSSSGAHEVGTKDNHRALLEEDMNLLFRQLFGYEDVGMSISLSLSLSLSMPPHSESPARGPLKDNEDDTPDSNDGQSVSPVDTVNVPSSPEPDLTYPDQVAPVAEVTANTKNASSSASSNDSTGSNNKAKKAMVGVLAAAGLAVAAAVMTQRFKKKQQQDGNSSEQSVVDSNDGQV